ncbi:MAG: hypothetical protein OXI96_05055 [Acidimicrobiaceae bacterium]|nr:hypothetical protein [Acidimicrobiaceae bacterium]
METTLRGKTEKFADTLNRIVEVSIDTDIKFQIYIAEDAKRANLQPMNHLKRRSNGFPLVRRGDDPQAPALLLVAKFVVEMDGEAKHLQVASSTIGLWVDVTCGSKSPRPLIRVEYDRRKEEYDRTLAHVHLHAHSPELAWIYGSSGQPALDLHRLHFPVGGRRFRPTLEEFLLFLDREKLYTNFKMGWKPKVQESLQHWEEIQAAATVRRFPHTATHTLEKLGYTVIAPVT